jgi:predicted O-methyltransferase YrrM
LDWVDDRTIRVDGTTFTLSIDSRFQSTSDHFLLVKDAEMVRRYEHLLATLRPRRIVELGICQGGSTALLALLTEPEHFVAVDLKSEPTLGLERFLDERGLRERVRTHYAVDQADTATLRSLVDDEFGEEPLDLVIDDASHLIAPTRVSFNLLFPRLRPGGVFVIEDWSGVHHWDASLARKAEQDAAVRQHLGAAGARGESARTPLSIMLFELILAAAYAPEIFSEVFVTDNWAYVTRGPGALDGATFDLSAVYTDFARTLLGRTA